MKEFAESLERLAQLFRDGEMQDPYANEIVYLLEDKAHDIKLDTKEADDEENDDKSGIERSIAKAFG